MRNLAHPHHRLLALDFGFDALLAACTGGLLGHRQVTVAWLLTAGIRHGARLLTFDGGVSQLLATPAERAKYLLTP